MRPCLLPLVPASERPQQATRQASIARLSWEAWFFPLGLRVLGILAKKKRRRVTAQHGACPSASPPFDTPSLTYLLATRQPLFQEISASIHRKLADEGKRLPSVRIVSVQIFVGEPQQKSFLGRCQIGDYVSHRSWYSFLAK